MTFKKGWNKKRKANKARNRRRSSNMAKRGRKGFRRRASGFGRASLGSLRGGKIGEVLKGIGAADVIDDVTSRFAPQWTSIARPVAGYAAGGILGAIAVIGKDMLVGMKIPAGSEGATATGYAI